MRPYFKCLTKNGLTLGQWKQKCKYVHSFHGFGIILAALYIQIEISQF